MPDFKNFDMSILATGKLAVNPTSVNSVAGVTTIAVPDARAFDIPVVQFAGQIVDSQTQTQVVFDFSGANAIRFALRVDGFSLQDHKDLAQEIAQFILRRRAGLG